MSSNSEMPSERTLALLGAGSGVMQLVAFTAVGVLTLDNVPYGAVVGAFGGVGAFLFVPWFVGLSAAQDEGDTDLTAAAEQVPRNVGSGVFGLGLELGAISALGLGLARGPNLLLGAAGGLAVAVGVYLVGSFVLDQ